jgi:hypothetical protein
LRRRARDALLDTIGEVRRKLLGVELLTGLGKLDGSTGNVLADLDLDEGKKLARQAVGLIKDGTLGYALVTVRRES